MNRNKMVDLITCYLNERENNGPLANITDNADFANYLLTKIEEQGMKPPSLSEDQCQALMDVYYAGYSFNQWDDDFEKDTKVMAALKKRQDWKRDET